MVCLGCGSDASLCGFDTVGYCLNCGSGMIAAAEEYEQKKLGGATEK